MRENITNSSLVSQCVYCRHKIRGTNTRQTPCKAFPDGIPHSVVFNKVWHIFPIEGDHGIQFEPLEDGFLAPIAQQLYEEWKRKEEEKRAEEKKLAQDNK